MNILRHRIPCSRESLHLSPQRTATMKRLSQTAAPRKYICATGHRAPGKSHKNKHGSAHFFNYVELGCRDNQWRHLSGFSLSPVCPRGNCGESPDGLAGIFSRFGDCGHARKKEKRKSPKEFLGHCVYGVRDRLLFFHSIPSLRGGNFEATNPPAGTEFGRREWSIAVRVTSPLILLRRYAATSVRPALRLDLLSFSSNSRSARVQSSNASPGAPLRSR